MQQAKNDTIIKIEHVTRRFRTINALDDFSLAIPRGTIYGLIGPNGAGKTTLLRILAALLPPSSGRIWFNDTEVSRAPTAIQRKVGYMPDFFGVYPDLTTAEYLAFYAGIHGVPRKQRTQIITDLLELVDLTPRRNELVETLPRGMKQRLCLARTLVHDPELLLLDEPASGLDPRSRIELRELISTLQSMGKTIVISSHILLELAEMCTDIAIIQQGRLVLSGDVETVSHYLGSHRQMEIQLLQEEQIAAAVELLQSRPMISNVTCDEHTMTLLLDFNGDDQEQYRLLSDLISAGIPIVSFAPRHSGGRLEEVFMSVTEGSKV